MHAEPVIAFERLTKLYPGGRGVRDLELQIERGEMFGFIGPNGAGKSTAIRTLLGLLFPTAGQVRLLGRDATREGPQLRARVGYLPSEPRLYDGMTVGEILAHTGRFFAGDTWARRRELAAAIDLDLSRRADDLSLGNKKKVALVAALQHAPEVLVLDEPTSGLDPLVQARLFELLRAERGRGATVFFSSHVLSEVERECERVAIIREGRIVEVARVEALRARQVKRVRARVKGEATRLAGLAGVRELQREGADHGSEDRGVNLRFVFAGAVPELLAALAAEQVEDVTIEEPSLEEVVLSRYGPEAGGG